MQTGPFVSSNAFSSLLVGGLIKINGIHVPLTLSKTPSKPAEVLINEIKEGDIMVVGPPPVRPPSKLPPLGNLCLDVSLEPGRLGYGRVGSVYPLRMHDTNQYALPSLVIKVATRRRSEDLAREAWFYEEMEDIQGIAIARCYGFFTAEIDPNSEVLGWAESDAAYDEQEVEHLDEDSQSQDDDDWDDRWNPDPCAEYSPDELVMEEVTWEMVNQRFEEKRKKRRHAREEKQKKRRHASEDKPDSITRSTRTDPSSVENGSEKTFLSILVLERLGDVIPMGVPLEAVKPDVHEIYSDMGRFGVEHRDIRWRNILAAPATQHSVVCPYHGHKHRWRVVDFDRSRKSNFSHYHIECVAASWLEPILDALPKGYVVEPWD